MAAHSTSPAASALKGGFMIPAPNEPGRIDMYSPQFYAACAVGGILSCGLTHMAVTPLDLVSRNLLVSVLLVPATMDSTNPIRRSILTLLDQKFQHSSIPPSLFSGLQLLWRLPSLLFALDLLDVCLMDFPSL